MSQVLLCHSGLRDYEIEGLFAGPPASAEPLIEVVGQVRIESIEQRSHESGVGLGHEDGDATAELAELVAVLAWDPYDDLLATKAAEVVGHSAGRVAAWAWVVETGHAVPELLVCKTLRCKGERSDTGEERHGARFAPAECWYALTVVGDRR